MYKICTQGKKLRVKWHADGFYGTQLVLARVRHTRFFWGGEPCSSRFNYDTVEDFAIR